VRAFSVTTVDVGEDRDFMFAACSKSGHSPAQPTIRHYLIGDGQQEISSE
jgi:hypothetical protein